MTWIFLLAVGFYLSLFSWQARMEAQTLLKDTGRGLLKVGKAAGKVSGKGAKQAGRATGVGAKKVAHFSARKVNQGTAKLEEKTK